MTPTKIINFALMMTCLLIWEVLALSLINSSLIFGKTKILIWHNRLWNILSSSIFAWLLIKIIASLPLLLLLLSWTSQSRMRTIPFLAWLITSHKRSIKNMNGCSRFLERNRRIPRSNHNKKRWLNLLISTTIFSIRIRRKVNKVQKSILNRSTNLQRAT